MSETKDSLLSGLLAGPMRAGAVMWIGLRPDRKAPVATPIRALLTAGRGIEGDRYKTTRDGGRQVTLVASEGLDAVASYLGRDGVPPELLRRNLLTRGINLLALKGRRFRVGVTLLEYSGECAPCSQMETLLGPGGYNAVRGNGGICARILEGGVVNIGDAITRAD